MKTLLIFRGLAANRRNSLIEKLRSQYSHSDSIRIDTPQPKVKLTREQLKDLSVHSFNEFKNAIAKDTELIMVNNANLKHYHYAAYANYAQKYGYIVGIVIVPWNDLSDRDLSIDSGGEVTPNKFKAYRKVFEWGDFSTITRPSTRPAPDKVLAE